MATELFHLERITFLHILDIPELMLNRGEITALVGASGSGKSSLLRLLNKLASPTDGIIWYNGQNLNELDSVAHRRQVTMLMQNPPVFPGDVRDNLLTGHRLQGRPGVDDEHLKIILNDLQLRVKLEQDARSLSGGEKQRLAIGRLMLLDPPVWLLDEPSSALDRTTEVQIVDMIASHIRTVQKTLVMITHSPEIAAQFADRIVQIDGGKVVADTRTGVIL